MNIDKVVQIAKRRGFVFPSSEIYGGLSGFFDYGPLGVLLKRKLENYWRETFVKPFDNIFEIESSQIMPEKVWEASGHLRDFVDPLTQCQKCHSNYRADNLIEEQVGTQAEGLQAKELTKLIEENKIKCPRCKGNLSEVRIFNLMLSTNVGPVSENTAYLRAETAQGIFVNFKNILASTRTKLPFGVAQGGYSYRNEISPRQWIMRLREFRQMEIEYFFNPEKKIIVPEQKILNTKIRIVTREEQKKKNPEPLEISALDAVKKKIIPNEILAYFLVKEFLWYQSLGIPKDAIRFRHMKPEETPHYSKGNFDMEIKFDFGWKEVVGNAYRADYDLSTHTKYSGEDLSIVEDEKKIRPHVIEPSFGIDRTIYAILLYAYNDEKREWEWLKLPVKIAPYVVGIFPLVKKDKLPEKAMGVFQILKKEFDAFYDDSGSIGKRYARGDETGVPLCVTIDYDTLKDNNVTIRNRDTTKQVRVKIAKLVEEIKKLTSL